VDCEGRLCVRAMRRVRRFRKCKRDSLHEIFKHVLQASDGNQVQSKPCVTGIFIAPSSYNIFLVMCIIYHLEYWQHKDVLINTK
jgi:hypothetical protein